MQVSPRDRRLVPLLVILALGLILALRFRVFNSDTAAVVAPADSIPMAEKRLERLRQIAATVPGKEAVLKQVKAEIDQREAGILIAQTAPQAQAHLLDVIRRIGTANGIDARGAEELRVRPLAGDYGEVLVAITFTCRIEQLVNFLAALANEPEILATNELHVSSGDPKQKTVQVRLSVSAVVQKKLVPEKKGVAAF